MPLIDFSSLVAQIVSKNFPYVGTTYVSNIDIYLGQDDNETTPPLTDDNTGRRFFVWGISAWEENSEGEADIVAP